MTPYDMTVTPQSSVLQSYNAPAPSNKGVVGPLLSSMLTGAPGLGSMAGIVGAAFAEDPGNMTFLPEYDGGKINAGAATKTTVFGPIQTGGAAASGWAKASSSPSQTAPQTVTAGTPEPVTPQTFPIVLVVAAGLFLAVIALMK
jgi:hypothetical protein